MSNFKEGGKMRKEILNFIIRHLRENEIKNLSEVFTSMDREKTGHITADDILYALN
jgi:Ca2+-binding EF-hand superfamily protein